MEVAYEEIAVPTVPVSWRLGSDDAGTALQKGWNITDGRRRPFYARGCFRQGISGTHECFRFQPHIRQNPRNEQPSVTGNEQPSVTGNEQPSVTGNEQPSVTGNEQPLPRGVVKIGEHINWSYGAGAGLTGNAGSAAQAGNVSQSS